MLNIDRSLKGREYMRADEVCIMLGITRMTLWRWEKKGFPVIRKQGINPIYLRANVIDWVNDNPKLDEMSAEMRINNIKRNQEED